MLKRIGIVVGLLLLFSHTLTPLYSHAGQIRESEQLELKKHPRFDKQRDNAQQQKKQEEQQDEQNNSGEQKVEAKQAEQKQKEKQLKQKEPQQEEPQQEKPLKQKELQQRKEQPKKDEQQQNSKQRQQKSNEDQKKENPNQSDTNLKKNKQTESSEKKNEQSRKQAIPIPSSVMSIAKENTYPNPIQDIPQLQPSDLTKELILSSKVKIENPELIRMLNESSVNGTPFAFGYRATIYLGKWPLNYESTETTPNWEYQKINTNYQDNRGGNSPHQMHYVQEMQKVVRGGLTAKIPKAENVRKMMHLKAAENSELPLSFETVIGGGTKKDHFYNIPANRLGYLYAYAPAINEKGKVTYGEVYVVLKGNKKSVVIKNVTTQGIGAWIPVQDYVSFSFLATERPR